MNELLTWGLTVFVSLALFALCYNQLQVATRSGDYMIAQGWFGIGALVLVVRFMYWRITSNRDLTLRAVICVVVCGGVCGATVAVFSSINHKRQRWVESNQPSASNAAKEESQWHQTAQYDLTSREAAPRKSSASREEAPKPNLVFTGAIRISVHTNDNGTMVDSPNVPRTATWRLKHPTYVATVVTYHNQYSESHKVCGAKRVSAQLTYEFPGGVAPFVVPRALWFPLNVSTVDFAFNDAYGFVLAVVNAGGRLCAAQKAIGDPHQRLATNINVLPANEVTARVRLISEADGSVIKESKFRVQNPENRFSGAVVTEIS